MTPKPINTNRIKKKRKKKHGWCCCMKLLYVRRVSFELCNAYNKALPTSWALTVWLHEIRKSLRGDFHQPVVPNREIRHWIVVHYLIVQIPELFFILEQVFFFPATLLPEMNTVSMTYFTSYVPIMWYRMCVWYLQSIISMLVYIYFCMYVYIYVCIMIKLYVMYYILLFSRTLAILINFSINFSLCMYCT